MAIVFKTPKSTLNTTSKQIQNLGGDCPPCPEPVLEGKELNYTQNGEYTVTPEQGVDGFSSIDVTVNVPTVNNQNKSVTITENGTSTVSADSGYSGLGDVTVEVNVVPTMAIAHIDPSTEHQTITPPAIYDGYASIEVNAVTNLIDRNIAAGNIKDGVTILGVTGNYSGSTINNQNKTVSPSTSQQSVSADQGYTGLGTVTVNAVTAAIDANIVAENILDGVTILGVTGSDLGYDAGYSDGYAQGQAECPEPGGCDNTAYVQETITTNGTYTYDPSDYQGSSYDAFDGVEITVNVSGGTPVAVTPFTITSLVDNNTISFKDPSNTGIEYSLDGGITWQRSVPVFDSGESRYISTWTIDEDEAIQFRDNRATYQVSGINASFDSSGNAKLSGNISTLVDKNNPDVVPGPETFNSMFSYKTHFVDASDLVLLNNPANSSYRYMFQNCTGLVSGPTIPSTYLPVYCCAYMFKSCTSLTTAPVISAKIIGQNGCVHMFDSCTALTTAPALPATILEKSCYSNMFWGCSNLTTAPELPSMTLENNCYEAMFQNCASLTTAPVLPAQTLSTGCYKSMFNNCGSLNYVKAMFTTTPGTSYTSNWLTNVAATGTFVKNAEATWNVEGANGIPTGWTVQTASA